MYKTRIFDDSKFWFMGLSPIWIGPKNHFPKGINGDFFLMTIYTLEIRLTKFQLHTILFGVKTIFSLILLDY